MLAGRNGVQILGGVLLGIALWRIVTGGNWVTFAIIGVLFGGLSLLKTNKKGPDAP